MSKSVGNLVRLHEVLADYGPDELRWYLLGPPYHSRLEWDDRMLQNAAAELERLRSRFHLSLADGGGGSLPLDRVLALPNEMQKAIEDGFSPDQALRVLRDWSEEIGRAAQPMLPRGSRTIARRAYDRAGEMLGICLT
jgi:cysteinyl-tRNA synthetase